MEIARRFLVFVFLATAAGTALGQPETKKLPNGLDPFAIGSGTSFAASSAGGPDLTRFKPLPSSITTDVDEALALIERNYVSSRPNRNGDLTKSAINTMLKTLDPHSSFFDPAEFQELIGEERSEYFGTGSTIVSYERNGDLGTYVIGVVPGSTADRAGMRYGDRIISVNSRSVRNETSMTVRDMIRGPLGTAVSVTVERDGRQIVLPLKRERIPQPTVTNAFLMDGRIGMIEMSEGFSFTTYDEFDRAYKQLRSQGMSSLIIDLRGNPGGILEQSIKIAEKFLPAGTLIVSQKGRFSSDDREWRSANRNPEQIPLVLLVNSESASASEVLAGALQDNDRAFIVGEKTFGKGLVQSVLDLPGRTGMALTTAKYYTPSGRSIQRDYSSTGIYDYYNHTQTDRGPSDRRVSFTTGKRKVYGGDGITPDQEEKGEAIERSRIDLLDPMFFFSLGADAPASADENTEIGLFERFATSGNWPFISTGMVNKEKDFVLQRIRYNRIIKNEGLTAGGRFLLENDPQVKAARLAIPSAAAFVTHSKERRTVSLK